MTMARERKEDRRQRAAQIVSALRRRYPNATTALQFQTPWELLVATILSAQCTDERVNQVTRSLFKKYPAIEDYAAADLNEFQEDIHSTGFFRKKAKTVIAAAQTIVTQFGGRMPETMDELLSLPGVARKTANLVLGVAFGKTTGIVVDTHVTRLAQRLNLTPKPKTKSARPDRIEQDLMAVIPEKDWTFVGLALILHGRETCTARNPRCDDCCLRPYCPQVGVAS